MPNLNGKVCLVTGGSRGVGRGIAIQLTTYGATCYVTGRNLTKLEEVKKEAELRGSTGKCIPIRCDHSVDSEVEEVFKRIDREQNGRLDLLVNNAYSGVKHISETTTKYFWDNPPESWDEINNVGLRNHYFCTVYASRMMVPRRQGLIVNISSIGGKIYFLLPVYGIGKVGKDRMARDCAAELFRHNVAFVSLWPGPVRTEFVAEELDEIQLKDELSTADRAFQKIFRRAESTELCGKGIAYLLADEKIMDRSGEIVTSVDLAEEFRFNDIDGSLPPNLRTLGGLLSFSPLRNVAAYIPSWIKIPKFLYMIILNNLKPVIPGKRPSCYA